jgi:hypothetical protein
MLLLLFLRTSFRSGGDDEEGGPGVAAAALRTFRSASHTALRSAPLEEGRRRCSGCVKVGDASGVGEDCAAWPPTKLAKSLARTLMVRTVLLVDGLELKGSSLISLAAADVEALLLALVLAILGDFDRSDNEKRLLSSRADEAGVDAATTMTIFEDAGVIGQDTAGAAVDDFCRSPELRLCLLFSTEGLGACFDNGEGGAVFWLHFVRPCGCADDETTRTGGASSVRPGRAFRALPESRRLDCLRGESMARGDTVSSTLVEGFLHAVGGDSPCCSAASYGTACRSGTKP